MYYNVNKHILEEKEYKKKNQSSKRDKVPSDATQYFQSYLHQETIFPRYLVSLKHSEIEPPPSMSKNLLIMTSY